MRLRSVALDDAYGLARIHAGGFDHPWSESEMAEVLMQPGMFGLAVEGDGPAGFVLCRAMAGEAEVLTLAVDPAARRSGIGLALMTAAVEGARALGAESLFLEVAVDNAAAIALYQGLGFSRAGVRRGYYRRRASGAVDALVMRLSLNS
ncbi:MAG: ribosomal-protein-alanine acetyltransferase [Caulobacter sp.]|jgi:ribosomal-protein-alanine N-acetyltransferase|nr:ribosomal-protein-alanine acetyltransferase [Caulobacter sp.]